MTPTEMIGVIGAVGGLFTAMATAVGSFIMSWRNAKKAEEAVLVAKSSQVETKKGLDEIHILVDGRLDAALEKIDGLERHIVLLKGDIPPKPA